MADKTEIDIQIKATGGDAAAAEVAKPIAALERTAAAIEALAAQMGIDIGKGYRDAVLAAMEGATPELIAAAEAQQAEILATLKDAKERSDLAAVGRMTAEADIRDYESQVRQQAKATEAARDAFKLGSEDAERFREHVAGVGVDSSRAAGQLDSLLRVVGRLPGPLGDTARELGGVLQALGSMGRAGGPLALVAVAFTAAWKGAELLANKLGEVDRARAMLPELSRQTKETVTPADQAAAAFEAMSEALVRGTDARKRDAEAIKDQIAGINELEAAMLAEREAEIDLMVARREITEGEGEAAKRAAKRGVEDENLARERLRLQVALAQAQRTEQEANAAFQAQANVGGPVGKARDALNRAITGRAPELTKASRTRAGAIGDLAQAQEAGDEEKAAAAKAALEKANEEFQEQQRKLIEMRREEFEQRREEFEKTQTHLGKARLAREAAEADLGRFDDIGARTRETRRRAEDLSDQAKQERAEEQARERAAAAKAPSTAAGEGLAKRAEAALQNLQGAARQGGVGFNSSAQLVQQFIAAAEALRDGASGNEAAAAAQAAQALSQSIPAALSAQRREMQALRVALQTLQSQVSASRSFD